MREPGRAASQHLATEALTGSRPTPFFAYPRSVPPMFAPTGDAIAYAHTWDGKLASREDLYVDGRDVTAALGPLCADDSSFHGFGQFLPTHGVAYSRPDPRGSDGYGDWSYKAIVGNTGDGPMADVLAGVAAVLATGVGDKDRLFLEGGSYGGYLTSWIITHDHRFKGRSSGCTIEPVVWAPTVRPRRGASRCTDSSSRHTLKVQIRTRGRCLTL